MTCAENRRFLQAHADQELDVAHSLEVERHLHSCTACAAQVDAFHSLKTSLQDPALRFRAPESLRSEFRRMARRTGGEMERRFDSLWLWKWWSFGATAVAALALLLSTAGRSDRDQLLNEAVASHVRSLMAEHLTDVASTDQHTVKPWFNGKLDFAPDVRDFAAEGFPLTGGRLDYLNGRSVAALIYRRNKHFINVFVWPATNPRGATLSTDHRRGYCLINRQAGGLHYCLVSDLNEKELSELAALLAP